MPEEVVAVGIEPRAGKRAGEDVEDVVDGGVELIGVGQGARIGLAGRWLVAVKFECFDDAGGRGALVAGFVSVGVGGRVGHGVSSLK